MHSKLFESLRTMMGKINSAETRESFKAGDRVKVYTKPTQQEGFEGFAELVEFVGNDTYEGAPVERWKVRFDYEVPLYERIIYKPASSLFSRWIKIFERPSAVQQNSSGTEQIGTGNLTENEWESLRTLMRKINSAENEKVSNIH